MAEGRRDVEADMARIQTALDSGKEPDIWGTADLLTDLSVQVPEKAWRIIARYGISENEEVRGVIATCALEHLLEHHFESYFNQVEAIVISGNPRFADTLMSCSRFENKMLPDQIKRWDSLLDGIKNRRRSGK